MKKMVFVVLIAFLGALVFFTSVFADSETPPDAPVIEQEINESAAPAEGVVTTEETPLSEIGEFPVEDADINAPDVDPLLTKDVVLADAQGEVLDLVSQNSAELLIAGDPYWMVGTQKYAVVFIGDPCPSGTTLGSTCWQSATPINAALAKIESSSLIPTNKKLYIVGGTTFVEDILINGSSVSDTNKSKLTGFIGEADALGAYPVLDGNITLQFMKFGFSISNLTINGFLNISGSQGVVELDGVTVTNSAGTGITIGDSIVSRHKGNVTIKNVKANNNSGTGTVVFSTGVVTVTNSTFNSNSGHGLSINSNAGTITINGIVARGNANSNLRIEKFEKALSVTNAILHDSVAGDGLYAVSTNNAPATLRNIYAFRNDQYGIHLTTGGQIVMGMLEITDSVNKSGVFIDQTAAKSTISVANSRLENNAASDSGDGLEIKSLGNVLLTSISSSYNSRQGVNIDNCQYDIGLSKCKGTGTIIITSPANSSFQVANYFEGNWSNGLRLVSNNSVTLTNLQSNYNSDHGLAYINYNPAATLTTNTNLKTWSNTFNSNGLTGISITSPGHVSLNNTDALYNQGNGILTTANIKNVAIANGVFNYNGLSGVRILSSGNVILTNVDASGNGWDGVPGDEYGVYINNSTGTGNVTITTSASYLTNAFNDNGTTGLYITTKGLIAINNTQAYYNSEYGMYMNNVHAPLARNVTLTNATAINNLDDGIYTTSKGTITFNRVTANNNQSNGIYATTLGAISFSNITANNNFGSGVWIDGCPGGVCTSLVNFTLGGAGNTFNNNGDDGLGVYTKGTISLRNVSAADNLFGVYLFNDYGGVTNGVTISNSGTYRNIIERNKYGLNIYTRGNISLTWVFVNENEYGAELDNSNATVARVLTMTNCDFNGNESTGLFTNIRGNIIANSIIASYNSTRSGSIDPVDGAIITERLTSDTGYDIWNIDNANGNYTITLSNTNFDPAFEVWDADTGTLMYYVDDNGMVDPESITFNLGSPTNIYIKVFGYGMGGEYTLNVNDGPVVAMLEYYGAHLTNFGGNVTVGYGPRGLSHFSENNSHGLFIESTGVANIDNMKAERNGGHGVYIINAQNVVAQGTHKNRSTAFSHNQGDGLRIESLGSISIRSTVEAFGNGTYGIYLNNAAATTAKPINASKAIIYWNSLDGLHIIGSGAVTLESLESYQNFGNGVYVDNAFGTSGLVTVRGANRFNRNFDSGIFITTLKSADILGVRSEYNWGHGIEVISLSGTTRVNDSTLRYNARSGLLVQAFNPVTINNIRSVHNGDSMFYDAGAYIVISGAGNLTISNSVFQANYGAGIEADLDTGKLSLSNTSYFGNDYDGTGLYDDLYVY